MAQNKHNQHNNEKTGKDNNDDDNGGGHDERIPSPSSLCITLITKQWLARPLLHGNSTTPTRVIQDRRVKEHTEKDVATFRKPTRRVSDSTRILVSTILSIGRNTFCGNGRDNRIRLNRFKTQTEE